MDACQPGAVQQSQSGQLTIYAVTNQAKAVGVEPGLSVTSALALCPGLQIVSRDLQREQQAMQALAAAALAFSPWVSLDVSDCLLLEISSCLTLFGGAVRLREQLRQVLTALHYRPVLAISPTPTASELMAKQGLESLFDDTQALKSALGGLSIDSLLIEDKLLQRLQRIGAKQLVDLWRLPRDGLARRYGKPLLQHLDALAGNDNRMLRHFHQAPRFIAHRDMPTELERLEHFFPAIKQLADEFAAFLLQRDAAALGLTLFVRHYRRPATRISLTFRTAHRDARHWCGLLQEKLERTALPAPVLALTLSSKLIAPFLPETPGLFDEQIADTRIWLATLEQLQARLGAQALRQLSTTADHRPERAMINTTNHAINEIGLPARPLWLLPQPQPVRREQLTLLSEAERIESGWWDGAAVRRDYQIAADRQGRKLWVYQELNATRDWFVHGLFG